MAGVVKPVQLVNDQCEKVQDKLDCRLPILTSALKWLTIQNFVVCFLSLFLAFGAISIYVIFSMEQEMAQTLQTRVKEEIDKVHAQAQANENTLVALSQLGVQIELHPRKDWNGNDVPNSYVLAMKGAWSGWTTWKHGERYGTILFKDQSTQLPMSFR